MELHPRINWQGRRLLQHSLDVVGNTLEPGWHGDATRTEPDLLIMREHLPVGLVGINPQTERGQKFALHTVLGGAHDPKSIEPPLALVDMQGVVVCGVPVWPTILELAVQAGLAVEITENPEVPPPIMKWRREEGP